MDTKPATVSKGKFRRQRKRFLLLTVVLFAVLISGAGGAAFWLQGRELVAPPWLRDRLTERLETVLPDAQIRLGDIIAIIDDTWLPQIFVRNLEVRAPSGEQVVTLANVSVGLDRAALMDRRIALGALRVTGVVVTLRRDASGQLSLSAGSEAGAVSSRGANLAQLVTGLDLFFLRPAMAELNSIDVRAITLRYEDARAGRAWTADGGRMRVARAQNALEIALDLAILSGSAQVATLAANYSGTIGETVSEFGVTLANLDARDIASQSPAFSWLSALEAPISGALRGGMDGQGALRTLNATLQIGAGNIQPTSEATPIPINGASSYFTYQPQSQSLRFDQFSIDSKWGSGNLEGQAQLSTRQTGQLEALVGQFRLNRLRVNPADLYPAPVEVDGAELDFRMTLAPFALDIGRIQVTDSGQVLTGAGDVSVTDQGWQIALDGQMDGISTDRLKALWPERLKEKTRRWIGENILSGQVKQASGAFRFVQGSEPDAYIAFDFQDADVRFLPEMPPIEHAQGHASLVKDRFVLIVDEGSVQAPEGGPLDVAGSSFIVPDTRAKPDPPAVVRLTAKSSVTGVLSMLDQPPLAIMQKTPLPVSVADGDIDAVATLSMPLKKGTQIDEVEFDVAGRVANVRSDVLVPNRTVVAEALDIVASEKEVRIDGRGTLDDVPVDVTWRQPIGRPEQNLPGEVTGRVEITPTALAAFGIDLPPGMTTGQTYGDLMIRFAKGAAPQLNLSSDLQGLRLAVPEIGWIKPSGGTGQMDISVMLGDTPQVDAISLTSAGLSAQGNILLTEDQKLDRVQLRDVQIGNWLDAPVDLVGRGEGRPVGIVLRGGTVDLRRADLPRGSPDAAGTTLTVALDRLQVSDTIAITDMTGAFSTDGGLSGRFDGAVNGEATVTGRVTPQNDRSAIRIRGDNAGRLFAAAGLLQTARGGTVDLELVPVGTGGAFDGKLSVENTRITDAPAIAALLNSISVVGLINELNGDGIYFSDIDADFRLAPSRITLRSASAVGASMGLSMDGVFEPDTGAIQMQGVISPVYMLNAIGSFLTRRGEGLFGFNYSITGTAENPSVFVNPLTALAPGMLRNLFRGAQPEVPMEEGEPERPVRRAPVVTRGEDR